MILSWIYHIYFNKFLDENWTSCKRLDTRYYRLLAKYKQNKDSNNLGLKGDKPFSGKENKQKNKLYNRSPLNKAQYYTEVIDYDNGLFDSKHFYFKRKLIKKQDYDIFLEQKRRICNMALKKIKFRKYKYGAFMFFLFFLFAIGLPILQGFDYLKTAGDWIKTNITLLGTLWTAVEDVLSGAKEYFFLISFGILMVILSVILLIALYKLLINNKKYNKIKLMSELYV
ncbi:Plasmodium exported protein (Pm-fam-a like), unknown function [Plasmodium malariae]|uniref:Fam-m protein n=1 Tax=Plasmodium malariae TaxID=5858 RepID=A0A1A8X2W1_PLAMA|nr:Plasmodium exported protein (Pm-fam-a like), unknown function [Plasmodium malariae]